MLTHRIVAFALLLASSRADSIALVAGGGEGGDGSAAGAARLNSPFGLVETPSQQVVFVEMLGNRVRVVGARGIVETIAGTGREGKSGDGGPALQAEFKGPHALAVATNGDLFIADTWNNRVRKIDAKTRIITTVAGTGEAGFSGDGGPATAAKFGGIYSIALAADGSTMTLADLDNRRVRQVDLKTGLVRPLRATAARAYPKTARSPLRRRWSTPAPWRWIDRGESTSWNEAATPCVTSTARARSAPWRAPAREGTRATAGRADQRR